MSREILTSIDVLNVMNGGIAEYQLKLKQFPTHREIRVKVPGVKVENVRSEIHNNVLSIFYTTPIQTDSVLVDVPKVVYNKQIPYFVDAEKISAAFENDFYVVKLPFNSLAQGYHRSVSLEG